MTIIKLKKRKEKERQKKKRKVCLNLVLECQLLSLFQIFCLLVSSLFSLMNVRIQFCKLHILSGTPLFSPWLQESRCGAEQERSFSLKEKLSTIRRGDLHTEWCGLHTEWRPFHAKLSARLDIIFSGVKILCGFFTSPSDDTINRGSPRVYACMQKDHVHRYTNCPCQFSVDYGNTQKYSRIH